MKLEPKNVPKQFRHWVPLAEKWGIGCDGSRDEQIERASEPELMELIRYREQESAVLHQWLGPEARLPGDRSQEYNAFTSLAMAAEYAHALRNQSDVPTEKQQAIVQEILKWSESSDE